MLIGIIETGRPPEALAQPHGSYPEMFEKLLGGTGEPLAYRAFAAIDGEIPLDPKECDAWLITGSRHGVYEELPWMLALEAFIRRAFADKVPVVGICFGHQILAKALGGKVVKSDKGWGLGHHQYQVTRKPEWMIDAPDNFAIASVHQDQVVEVPKSGTVIASSEFCENAAIAYDDIALSFQGHPEFTETYQRDLYEVRLKPIVAAPIIDRAKESLDARDADSGMVAHWIASFLKAAIDRQRAAKAA